MGSFCSCERSEDEDEIFDEEDFCQPAREQVCSVQVVRQPCARGVTVPCQSLQPGQTTGTSRQHDQIPIPSTDGLNNFCITKLPCVTNYQNNGALERSSEITQCDFKNLPNNPCEVTSNNGTRTSVAQSKRRKRRRSRSRKENTPPRDQDPSICGAVQISGLKKTQKIPEGEIKKALPGNWSVRGKFPMPHCELVELTVDNAEYIEVSTLFKATISNRIIESVCRIENPYLLSMYLLKKEENEKIYGNCSEVKQFHCTKSENVNSICLDNFDWRRFGSHVGHRFGQGVSFSNQASYASFYCDRADSFNKMFVVRVLFSKICIGKESTVLPPAGFDTSIAKHGRVFVKYDDNCFYPEYLISFSGKVGKIH